MTLVRVLLFGLAGVLPALTLAGPDHAGAGKAGVGKTDLADVAAAHVDAAGYERIEPGALESRLDLPQDAASVFPAGASLAPMTRAVLLVEAAEGKLPRARWRIEYGQVNLPQPPAADPVPVSLIRVDRFNLGPAIHKSLEEIHGTERVAPAEHFGIGPHVSYRLVTRPIMGRSAEVVAASRRLYEPDESARSANHCLGSDCLAPEPVNEKAADWEPMGPAGLDFASEYPSRREGLPTPATLVDFLSLQAGAARLHDGKVRWTGFEHRESVEPGEPFVAVVVESGLGQDPGIDGVLHDNHVMDHRIEAVFHRVFAIGRAEPETARAVIRRPPPDFSGHPRGRDD